MRDLMLLSVHIVTTLVRLARPGGVRSVVAESILLKQLIVPRRLVRSAIGIRPSTILNFHRTLVHRKYRMLFSPKYRPKPGPKGKSRSDSCCCRDETAQSSLGALVLLSKSPWRSE